MKVRLFSLAAALVIFCLSVPGISARGRSDGGASNVVTLQYADWDKFDTGFIDEWNRTHPNIQVKFVSIPDNGEQQNKVDVLAMSGEIDITAVSDGMQFLRMQNGVLAPIDEYLKDSGIDMKRDFGVFADWNIYEGKYYCLPLRTSIEAVYYNKDMFDAAGVPYPKDDWTLDDYIATAKRMTTGSGQNKVYGTYLHTWDGEWAPLVIQGSAGWYTADGKSNIRDPALRRGLELRREMDDGGCQMSYSQIASIKTLSNTEFFSGRAAMAVSGAWMVRDMKNKERFPFNFKVGVAYIPRYSVNHPTKVLNMTSSSIGIPSNSKHKAEAWEFIKYYVTQHSSVIAQSGNVPCYQPAWTPDVVDLFVQGSGLPREEGQKFFDRSANIHTTRVLGRRQADYNQILADQTPLYFNGEKSLDQVIADIESRVNAVLAQ
jgi:multiple sugar transport system substrate-binding protein